MSESVQDLRNRLLSEQFSKTDPVVRRNLLQSISDEIEGAKIEAKAFERKMEDLQRARDREGDQGRILGNASVRLAKTVRSYGNMIGFIAQLEGSKELRRVSNDLRQAANSIDFTGKRIHQEL